MRNRNSERVRKVVGPLVLKMPIFGKLVTKIAVARFTGNLSMMLKAGVPLLQALDRAFDGREPGLHGLAQRLTQLGQADAAINAIEQLQSKLLLEGPHLLADGRLGGA